MFIGIVIHHGYQPKHIKNFPIDLDNSIFVSLSEEFLFWLIVRSRDLAKDKNKNLVSV